jgi:hypothetical protein
MSEQKVGVKRIRGLERVALAWRILTYEKGRTTLGIAGAFIAILLIFVELGFFSPRRKAACCPTTTWCSIS